MECLKENNHISKTMPEKKQISRICTLRKGVGMKSKFLEQYEISDGMMLKEKCSAD